MIMNLRLKLFCKISSLDWQIHDHCKKIKICSISKYAKISFHSSVMVKCRTRFFNYGLKIHTLLLEHGFIKVGHEIRRDFHIFQKVRFLPKLLFIPGSKQLEIIFINLRSHFRRSENQKNSRNVIVIVILAHFKY